jgi:hypothetical protein
MRLLALLTTLAVAITLAAGSAGPVLADDDNGNGNGGGGRNNQFGAQPFVFIGSAAECGAAGSNIVTSAWLGGMGLPDNGDLNPDGQDPHRGLLLNKNGPTPNCSSAGATINGFRPGTTLTELGFDYRLGGHCGGGAPRFNITTTTGLTYFAGCANGTQSSATQDPEWLRVRFTAAQIFPASAGAPAFVLGPAGTGTQVRSISIVYDEGTDTASPSDPNGVGLAVIDNIDVNGRLITAGSGVADGTNGARRPHRGGDEDNGDDRGEAH